MVIIEFNILYYFDNILTYLFTNKYILNDIFLTLFKLYNNLVISLYICSYPICFGQTFINKPKLVRKKRAQSRVPMIGIYVRNRKMFFVRFISSWIMYIPKVLISYCVLIHRSPDLITGIILINHIIFHFFSGIKWFIFRILIVRYILKIHPAYIVCL